MGKYPLNYPFDPWCNTCGTDIPMSVWNENNGECDECKKWWADNPPEDLK